MDHKSSYILLFSVLLLFSFGASLVVHDTQIITSYGNHGICQGAHCGQDIVSKEDTSKDEYFTEYKVYVIRINNHWNFPADIKCKINTFIKGVPTPPPDPTDHMVTAFL